MRTTIFRLALVTIAVLVVFLAGPWMGLPSAPSRRPLVAASAQPSEHIPVVPRPSPATLDGFRSKIQHIVYILKENRSFDNYFGTFPGADGATTGMISTGEFVTLGHSPDRTTHDLGHSWSDSHTAIDGGRM